MNSGTKVQLGVKMKVKGKGKGEGEGDKTQESIHNLDIVESPVAVGGEVVEWWTGLVDWWTGRLGHGLWGKGKKDDVLLISTSAHQCITHRTSIQKVKHDPSHVIVMAAVR